VGGVTWLDPFRAALDSADEPVTFFLRDDDAGWDDQRLLALVDLTAERELPLDLAVIPAELGPPLADRLLDRKGQSRVGLHQHGLAHRNHEPTGRKCEFGPARDHGAQLGDIAAGRDLLADLLGDALDPIFTPPWNRCTEVTGECLVELGFLAVSREHRAPSLGVAGLQELPVAVDWFAKRKGQRLSPEAVAAQLAAAVRSPEPVGIMFHHAEMDAAERRRAGELLDVLAGHPMARPRPLRAFLDVPAPGRSFSLTSAGSNRTLPLGPDVGSTGAAWPRPRSRSHP
jgi:hypothetical protein